MKLPKNDFDASAFYRALDSARAARGLNWKQVAEESGVSASTLTRLKEKRPDVDSLAALLAWSGLPADAFIRGKPAVRGRETLSVVTSYLAADPTLSEEGRDAIVDLVRVAYLRFRTADRSGQ